MDFPWISVPATRKYTEIEIKNKLRDMNDSLIGFYIRETKTKFSQSTIDFVKSVDLRIIRDTYVYDVIGTITISDIISQLNDIRERTNILFDIYLQQIFDVLKDIINEYRNLMFKEEHFMNISIKEIVGGYIKLPYKVENIKAEDIENRIKELIKELHRICRAPNITKEGRAIICEIIKIAEKYKERIRINFRPSTGSCLGAYFANDNRIELYINVIEEWLPNVDNMKKIMDVYAHELFHAFHYSYMFNKKKWEYDYESKMVKESLTRFIEYKYTNLFINNSEEIIADLEKVWNCETIYSFAYAGGKYYLHYDGLVELIFKDSLSGTKHAWPLLEKIIEIKE